MNIDDIGAQVSETGNPKNNCPRKPARLALIAATLFVLWDCTKTTIPRLDDRFDTDALGSPPSISPAPTPPGDALSFTVSQQLTSTIVADPAGGRWLRITPTPSFISSPDVRKRAIIITSEPFTTSPAAQIRGHFRLRLDGTGIVTVGLRPVQGAQTPNFIGGISLGNYLLTGGVGGQVWLLNEFSLAQVENTFLFPPSSGNKISDSQPGTPIDIFWSVDQASRNLAVGVSGGPSQTTTFAAVSAGIATTLIQQLSLWVWLQQPSSNTAVFVDNLYAEEYQ